LIITRIVVDIKIGNAQCNDELAEILYFNLLLVLLYFFHYCNISFLVVSQIAHLMILQWTCFHCKLHSLTF